MEIGVNLYGLGKLAVGEQFWDTAKKLSGYGCQKLEPMVMLACDREEMEGKPFLPPCIWQQDELIEKSVVLKEQYGLSMKSCHFGGLLDEDFSREEKVDCMLAIMDRTDIRDFVSSRLLATEEMCKRDAEIFQRVTEKIGSYGGRLLYHNHETEQQRITADGKEQMVIDYFLKLSPQTMLQVDVGWVMYSGVDEVQFLKDHIGRTAWIHLKDFKKGFSVERREKDIVAVGTGELRLDQVIQTADQAGLADQGLIVDQDLSPGDLMDDLKTGIGRIRKGSKR